MSFLLVKQDISQWVINSPLENHSAVPCNYGWPHKNQWRWEWKRAATLEKRKLGTLIVGESRMNNEQPDPTPWFGTFKSVRLIVFFFFLNTPSLAVYICQGRTATGSFPVQRGAIIPRYCCARMQTQGALVS